MWNILNWPSYAGSSLFRTEVAIANLNKLDIDGETAAIVWKKLNDRRDLTPIALETLREKLGIKAFTKESSSTKRKRPHEKTAEAARILSPEHEQKHELHADLAKKAPTARALKKVKVTTTQQMPLLQTPRMIFEKFTPNGLYGPFNPQQVVNSFAKLSIDRMPLVIGMLRRQSLSGVMQKTFESMLQIYVQKTRTMDRTSPEYLIHASLLASMEVKAN